PSKIETSEAALRNTWRFGGESGEAGGYQTRFEDMLRELYPGCRSLESYFNDVQIPYLPRFSYGNEIAVAKAATPLARVYETLAQRLVTTSQPWDSFEPGEDLSVIGVKGRELSIHEAAEDCLAEIELHSAGPERLRAAEALETMAAIKERMGKPTEAEAHYLEAIALYRSEQHEPGLASAVAGLARLERLMGRITESRIYYLDACRIYRELQSSAALASALLALGDLDARLGDSEAAGQHY